MKLSPKLVERTVSQFEGEVIPDSNPVASQLNGMFGDHTFFLGSNGLHIVEPTEPTDAGVPAGKVVKLASWTDNNRTSLAPHTPEATGVIIVFDVAA